MYITLLISFLSLVYQYEQKIQIYKNHVEILHDQVLEIRNDCQNIEKH